MVVSFANVFEPGCLGGETCGSMEVAYCWISAREFIHIVYDIVRHWETSKARATETDSESEIETEEEEEARSTSHGVSGSSGTEWSGASVDPWDVIITWFKYYIRTYLSDWVAAVLGLD